MRVRVFLVAFLLAFLVAGALTSPAAAQRGPAVGPAVGAARELSFLAQQIEESCPALVRFDPATGLRSVWPVLLQPALRQVGQQLALETARHPNPYEAGDGEPEARAEALRVLLCQLQRAQQLSGAAK